MEPSPTYHPPEGEECETSVEHWLPLWAEPAVGYCSRRPRPSPMWESRFVGAHAVGPWVGEQEPLGKTFLGGNPSPKMTYLPTFCFYWRSIGLCHANVQFSQLAKVLTKIALEGARVVVCTPDWGTTGEHAYWRRLLDRMTVGRTELPNGPIYVPEDSQETMPAPKWHSFLSIVQRFLA